LNAGAGAIDAPLTDPVLSVVREQLIAGGLTIGLPEVEPSALFGGDLYLTFGYLWFNRIHIFPNPLDFGAILTPTTRNVEVWNAYLEVAQTLDTVTPTTLPGVSIATGVLPRNLNPLQSILLPITATLDGPPKIDGSYEYDFASGIVAIGRVIGTRSFVWPLRHNWSTLPEEEIEWRTERLPGGSGYEQRITLRGEPRRFASLSYTAQGHKFNAFMRRMLWFGQPYQFSVPMWQDATVLTADAPGGSVALAANTVGRDFEDGGTVLIWRDSGTFEALQISTVATSAINLAGSTVNNWRAGDYVVPVRSATVPEDFEWQRITDRIGSFSVRWELTPGQMSTNRWTSVGLGTYRGLYIITRDSEASEDLGHDQPRLIHVDDDGMGIPRRFAEHLRPQPGFDYRRVLRDRADFADFLGLLYYLRGVQRPVWLPSWQMDFNLAQDILSGDTAIKVDDWGYAAYYNVAPSRRDIAIIKTDGTMIFRRILSVIASAGNTETIQLDSAVGQALTLGQVDRISFLRCAHLAGDGVKFTYETDTVATITVRFREQTTTP
jgi:hypothetical protein